MIEERAALDGVIATARRGARKFESLNAIEKREFLCDLWESIHRELTAAYHEQVVGHANYRLSAPDVLYARRVATWMRFELDLTAWRDIEENAAAEVAWRRVRGKTGSDAVLPDEVQRRIDCRPKPPDSRDPPILPPDPHNKPADWPPVEGMWSVWLEKLIAQRRPLQREQIARDVEAREPGEDGE